MRRSVVLSALAALACQGDRITQLSLMSSADLPVTLIGAGDIASCDPRYRDHLTAGVVRSVLEADPNARAFTAGDNAYVYGTKWNWACFDETWGAFKARTWFTLGNHEYMRDTSAKPTYDYILGVGVDSAENGKRGKGRHVHDFGAWRLYLLNSERDIAEQAAWLDADLRANPRKCQLMVFHRMLYTSSTMPGAADLRRWYLVFWKHRGDVVVNGHVHNYERTATIRPDTTRGAPLTAAVIDTATGFRVFLEGGGGHPEFTAFAASPKPYSQKRLSSHGVLQLRLKPFGYEWVRRDTAGVIVDQGRRGCR